MDSATETFSDSTKQPLLHQNPKPKTRPMRTIIISFLLLLTLVAAAFMLYSYLLPSPKYSKVLVGNYFQDSARYYCHLTTYPKLCFESMSATVNATSLVSNPTWIFSNSIQIAINQLNTTALAIPSGNTSSAMCECRKLVRDSLSRLNQSMCLFRDEYQLLWLTYQEMDDMKAWVLAAVNFTSGCLSAVEGEEGGGVEEVKVGVEKARKCMVNIIGLLEGRDTIVSDYLNSSTITYEVEDEYWPYYHYQFDYGMMYCVYSAVYLFLGLLYFLLWRGD